MSDLNVRSESVDVEQIMSQIRSRIREKRGVDYTEQEIRELANVKLEKFLDPGGVRSDLLEQYRKGRDSGTTLRNYAFEDTTLYGLCGGQIPMSSEWNRRRGTDRRRRIGCPGLPPALVTRSDRGASKMWQTRVLAARSSDV